MKRSEDRNPLVGLPSRAVPESVRSQLRVLASKEAARRRRRVSLAARWDWLLSEAILRLDNLWRPVAVPMAGGVVSASLLFLFLAPALVMPRPAAADVPTGLFTEAVLESSITSFMPGEHDLVVDVWVDKQGRVVDYSIPPGQDWTPAPEMLRSIENTLLCTKFTPATFFGAVTVAKSRITLRRSYLDVRG